MEVIDIAKKQLNSADHERILEKYGDYFEEIRDFGPRDRGYPETAGKRGEKIGRRRGS